MRTATTKQAARPWVGAVIVLLLALQLRAQNDQIAPRGQGPIGSYTFSDLETIDNVSGNLSYRIPLVSFAPNRGGFTWGLSLVYNSNIYDVTLETGSVPNNPDVTVNVLIPSEFGGWQYAINYGLEDEPCNSQGQGPDYGSCPEQPPYQNYTERLNLIFPDGSHHVLHLQQQQEDANDLGYYAYLPNGFPIGYGACRNGASPYFGYLYGNLTYYTTDSTYIKVVIPAATGNYSCANQPNPIPDWHQSTWTMYFPDGRVATGQGMQMESLADRNGNTMTIFNQDYNLGTYKVMLAPSVDRALLLYYLLEANGDSYHDEVNMNFESQVVGTWRVNWTSQSFQGSTMKYQCTIGGVGGQCGLNGTRPGYSDLPTVLPLVTSVEVPANCWTGSCPSAPVSALTFGSYFNPAGNSELVYGFGYDITGWGTLNAVTLPASSNNALPSATASYLYQNGSGDLTTLLKNPVVKKTINWIDESDGNNISVPPEITNYTYSIDGFGNGYTQIQNPDQGLTVYKYQPPIYASNGSGLANQVYQVKMPDGSLIERVWAQNAPPGIAGGDPGNPYVKAEIHTAASNSGIPTIASVRTFSVDRNGNQTELDEYDWVTYGETNVPHIGSNSNNPVSTTFTPGSSWSKPRTTMVVPDEVALGMEYWNPSTNGAVYGLLRLPASRTVSGALGPSTGDPCASSSSSNPASYDVYQYDAVGNLQHELHWDSTKTYSTTLGRNNASVIDRAYDAYGNITDVTDSRNYTTHLEYGTVSVSIPGYSPAANLYPTKKTEANGTGLSRATTFTYLSLPGLNIGAPDQVSDYNGLTRVFGFDFLGRTMVESEGPDAMTQRRWRRVTFDDVNRNVQYLSPIGPAASVHSQSAVFYDQLGRIRLTETLECSQWGPQGTAGLCSPLQTIDGQSGIKVQTRYRYSGNNSYKLVSNPYRATTTAGASGEDTMGWTLTQYDQNGRVNKVTSTAGTTLPYPFAGSAPTDSCSSPSNGSAYACYSASSLGITTQKIDEVGNSTTSYTDSLGRMNRVDESGFKNTAYSTTATTNYAYDAHDNLIGVTPDSGSTRSFLFDSMSRLSCANSPESGINKYTYDGNGNTTSRTDGRSIITCYGSLSGASCDGSGYDPFNRVILKTYSDGTNRVLYSYIGGSSDFLAVVDSVDTSILYGNYDELGRPGSVVENLQSGSKTITVNETYTDDDQPATITYPSGKVVTTAYDDAGRPVKVSSPTTTYATVNSGGYAAHGEVRNVTFGSGNTAIAENQMFTGELQPSTTTATQNGGPLLSLSIGYLANRNVMSETISRPSLTAYQNFVYDGANRLCSANEANSSGHAPADCVTVPGTSGQNWHQQYAYDQRGNRAVAGDIVPNMSAFTPSVPNATSPVPFNTQNQYTGASFNGGNLTSMSGLQLVYDAESRLASETDNNVTPPTTATFTYDGDGRRVAKSTFAGTTYYVYSPSRELISEYGGTSFTGTEYLLYDHLGSTRLVVNGSATTCHDYLPFGEEIMFNRSGVNCYGQSANQPDTSLKFTGEVRDSDTTLGLDYFGARYFSGAMGRFTSPDQPLIDQHPDNPQSWNLYSYVRNNPLKFLDPSGRGCVTDLGQGSDADHEKVGINNSISSGDCAGQHGTWVPGDVDKNNIGAYRGSGGDINFQVTTNTGGNFYYSSFVSGAQTDENGVGAGANIAHASTDWIRSQIVGGSLDQLMSFAANRMEPRRDGGLMALLAGPGFSWNAPDNWAGPGGMGTPQGQGDWAAMVHDYNFFTNNITLLTYFNPFISRATAKALIQSDNNLIGHAGGAQAVKMGMFFGVVNAFQWLTHSF
jgi:RHS repeat-associated protein